MSKKLEMHETYLISNARVLFVEEKFRIVDNPYYWIIDRTTVIKSVNVDVLPKNFGAPRFTPFIEAGLHLNDPTYIDVLGVVIDVLPTRNVPKKFGASVVRDFVIVDQEMKPLILSMWNDVLTYDGCAVFKSPDRMPIIAATRLTVYIYRGICLSARGFSGIVFNPSYQEAYSMRVWLGRNLFALEKLDSEKTYMNRLESDDVPDDGEFSTVSEVIDNESDSSV